jgi:hypothetical protein
MEDLEEYGMVKLSVLPATDFIYMHKPQARYQFTDQPALYTYIQLALASTVDAKYSIIRR